jgi:hypothetical protein
MQSLGLMKIRCGFLVVKVLETPQVVPLLALTAKSLKDIGYLSDLWYYDMNSSRWVWVSGDGLVNVTLPDRPSTRSNACGWITENAIWIFGGQGVAGTGTYPFIN